MEFARAQKNTGTDYAVRLCNPKITGFKTSHFKKVLEKNVLNFTPLCHTIILKKLNQEKEIFMPHITIQMYPGRDGETKKKVAEAVLEAASKALAREKEHFSVSIKDVPQDEWKEKIYDKVLKDPDTIIQPGYKM